ncbi:hypothetical protein [Novosphingobium panipatense]|uniref:hypothetical protein n=1 Tax=Novosphingobium panipatense TaxID=428991 RepID=UPI00360B07E0
MKITAAVMEKADGLVTRRLIALEEVELEGPREDEVLVRVTSCGVCGTDRGCLHGQEPYPHPACSATRALAPSRRLAGWSTMFASAIA